MGTKENDLIRVEFPGNMLYKRANYPHGNAGTLGILWGWVCRLYDHD